jgi:hypothetical protein
LGAVDEVMVCEKKAAGTYKKGVIKIFFKRFVFVTKMEIHI